uniref:Endonuclease/exonuclease/phosphatase domain-containing protein n=1 Tax=Arcella intermedia TaxID=1963864 RepID=A0A6B2LE74_9EUKA
MIALGNVIKSYRPDFIALQEVTSELLPLILQQKWAHEYFVSDTSGKHLESYGNVMLSRVSFKECVLHKLESRLGRKAMLGNFMVSGFPNVVMGTFHLESYLEDAPYRASQLKTLQRLTETFPNVILVGDTNFTSDEESSALGDRFSDAWKVLYQSTPEAASHNKGLTFDTETNSMAKEEYLSHNMQDPKSVRLDRCFFTHQTLEPLEMKILGQEPYMDQEYISDHYGIFIRLKLKPQ